MSKKDYRIRNWAQYNKSLVSRGSLTSWFDATTLHQWYEQKPSRLSVGRPKTYSNVAIEVLLHFKLMYNLSFRATQGFADSLFKLMNVPIRCCSYTQFCRRMQTFKTTLSHNVRGPIHMVIDSTGLKLYGEGEWKRFVHGPGKHRMWRKLHVGVDEHSGQIVSMKLTTNKSGDNKHLPDLLDMYPEEITSVSADKGYDGHAVCDAIAERGAYPAVLPQTTAKVLKGKKRLSARDKIVLEMESIGREAWKKLRKYHRRSLSETAFFRYKTLFGGKLATRLFSSQTVETTIRCNILNKFIQHCKPESYAIETGSSE